MEETMKASANEEAQEEVPAAKVSGFSTGDILEIHLRSGWLTAEQQEKGDEELNKWLERVAAMLGPQAKDNAGLEVLLRLIFEYDASRTLANRENQDVLMREGAREVIRELASHVLEGGDIDSNRFKKIVEELKRATPYRSRELFQPIRVALAGRAGGGELDRVILLLDAAAKLKFAVAVKSVRQRMIEFCAAFE